MKIFCKFPIVNIVICMAKNFIWTILKAILSIFRFFCTLRFQILQIVPYPKAYLFSFQMYQSINQKQTKKNVLLVLWSRVTFCLTIVCLYLTILRKRKLWNKELKLYFFIYQLPRFSSKGIPSIYLFRLHSCNNEANESSCGAEPCV